MEKNNDLIEKVEDYLIEEMGHYLDSIGGKPLLGRIWGFLMIHDRPVSLKEMSKKLKVSKAALSTTLSSAILLDLLKKVYVPEHPRENFYVLKADYMESILEPGLKKINLWSQRMDKALDIFDQNKGQMNNDAARKAYKKIQFLNDSLHIVKEEYFKFGDRIKTKIQELKKEMIDKGEK